MYQETCEALAAGAAAKARLLQKRPGAFFLSSCIAGGFIALGSIVFLSLGGTLTAAGCSAARFLAGLVFSAALSLVVMAGCDLFTGNNLTVGVGLLAGRVSLSAALALWAVCWLGNLAGSWLLALLFDGFEQLHKPLLFLVCQPGYVPLGFLMRHAAHLLSPAALAAAGSMR